LHSHFHPEYAGNTFLPNTSEHLLAYVVLHTWSQYCT
jgi:hypothetical protein